MEAKKISIHLWRVFDFARQQQSRWLLATEIADGAGVDRSVGRHHCYKLAAAKIFECDASTYYPVYRLSLTASRDNGAYLARLSTAGGRFRNDQQAMKDQRKWFKVVIARTFQTECLIEASSAAEARTQIEAYGLTEARADFGTDDHLLDERIQAVTPLD